MCATPCIAGLFSILRLFLLSTQGIPRIRHPHPGRYPQNYRCTKDLRSSTPVCPCNLTTARSSSPYPLPYPDRIADIRSICTEQIVIMLIVFPGHLSGTLSAKVRVRRPANPTPSQFCLRRRVDRIAFSVPDLFCGGGGGSNLETGRETSLFDFVF